MLEVPTDKDIRHAWMCRTVRESICRQVRELREAFGWTQGTLAKRMGTTASRISQLENPNWRCSPSIATLLKVAQAFDVALLIRFAEYSKFIIVMSERAMVIPYTQEAQSEPQAGRE